MIWRLLLAGALGGVVGAAELAARYRDDPAAALQTPPGLAYVAINSAAATAALVIVEAFGWTFGLGPDESAVQVHTVQVLVAGLGSAALFRSSLFTVRQGDQEIGIGPSALLTSLLGQVDRGVDRRRALARLNRDDLAGLLFDRDHVELTELCVGALQNLDKADAQALGELAARLKAEPSLSDPAKLHLFALKLLTVAGSKAVQAAARRLRERRAVEPPEPDAVAAAAATVPGDHAKRWRKRLAVIDPLVERPVQASGQLEAGLEMAWLYERLEEYDAARTLYEELTAALHDTSSPLATHELEIAWSRAELSFARGLAAEFPDDASEFRHALRERARSDEWTRIEKMSGQADQRLRALCSRPGGRPSSYAAALYLLVREGTRNRTITHLPHMSSEQALDYLSDALDILDALPESPRADHHTLICRLHFARASCYLAQGNPTAAADDLFRASESIDRDLQIISGSIGALVLHRLPHEQALALSRIIEPLGFPHGPGLGVDKPALKVRASGSEVLDWHRELATRLAYFLPDPVPQAPLRTFDLISSDETQIPKSFRVAPPAGQVAVDPAT